MENINQDIQTEDMVDDEGESMTGLRTPKEIHQNIKAAEKWLKKGPYKNDNARSEQWKKNKNYLMCVWDDSDASTTEVNTIFANHNTSRPALFFRNPKINADPAQPSFKRNQLGQIEQDEMGNPLLIDNYKTSKLMGLKINYELKELAFKKTLKKILSDVLCPYGVGWIKWGYSNNSAAGHSNQRERMNRIWCRRVDPRNLVYDWMETDSESLGFLAERVVMKRSRAEKEGFKIPEDYSVTLPDFLKDRDESCLESDKKSDLIIIWEYHDLEEDRIYWVLQDDSTEFPTDYAREPVDQPNPFEGSPYVPLVFNEDNDDVIGMSDVEPVEKQALAINRIRTKQTRHVDGFGTVVHYEEDSIEPKELSKTTDTDHGKYVKVKKGRLGALHVSGTPSMGNDNYNMDSVHKEDMRTTLGITDYQQGGADSRKATEAQIITNAANVRIMERRDVIYDFVIECVRRLSALIQTFSEEEEFLNVADMEFGEDFVDYLKNDYGFNPEIPFLRMKREDIQGEYNFKFSIEDMIVRPKEVQAQQFLQFLGLMGNPTMTAAAQEEGISLGKIFVKASELLDVDLEELKEGGPIQIPPLKENMMFKQGMEIPDPHKKDKHDEHMLIHNPVIQEITQSGQQLMQAKQQITMQIEQIRAAGEGMVVDHEGEQMAAQKMQEIDQQLQSMQLMLRRVKVHMQHHSQMQNAKSMQGMGGGQQPNQQAPNPNQSAQVGINAAARRGANAGV